jgi:hypothetical protein
MKRIVITFISVVILVGFSNLQAQFSEANITFDNLNHNFGNIKEEGGVVEHTFKFKNTGTKPLLVNNVRSSCGCTVPEWSKEPIPPGGSGSIKVSFNPLRRPGAFRKSVTVQSNAKEKTKILYIVGMVEGKPKTIADEYPIQVGPVRISSNHLSVGRIYTNEKKSSTLKIINQSDSALTITFPNTPEYVSLQVRPETLLPNQKGSIIGVYDAGKVKDWGFVSSRVFFHFNGERYGSNLLAVSGSIEEDFRTLTPEQKANGPRMVLAEETHNFGTIKQGAVIEHDFSFKNEGKETLKIRKIRTTCGCTASSPSSMEIAPGGEEKFHVTFNSRAKKGKQLQTITVITNDPNKPTHYLRMAGTVEVPEKK